MTRARPALSGLDNHTREHLDLETQENIDSGMSPEEVTHALSYASTTPRFRP